MEVLDRTRQGENYEYDLKIPGHWLYCRNTEVPEPTDEKTKQALIVLTEETKSTGSLWVEVLRVGSEVGRPRRWPKSLLRERKVARCLSNSFKPGVLICCPEDHPWGIKRSPLAKDELYVDEAVPFAIYYGEIDG